MHHPSNINIEYHFCLSLSLVNWSRYGYNISLNWGLTLQTRYTSVHNDSKRKWLRSHWIHWGRAEFIYTDVKGQVTSNRNVAEIIFIFEEYKQPVLDQKNARMFVDSYSNFNHPCLSHSYSSSLAQMFGTQHACYPDDMYAVQATYRRCSQLIWTNSNQFHFALGAKATFHGNVYKLSQHDPN